MAGITASIVAATSVAGLGMSAYGMSKQMEGQAQSAQGAKIQAQGAGIQAEGSAMQAQGALRQVEGANAQNQAQKEITRLEFLAEAQRFKAMEVDARRKNLEIVRQGQRARALGLASAAAQGAQFGSGLQGGYGQISGSTVDNLLGVSQNLQIGRSLFGINEGISNQRLAYAAGGDIINQGQGIIAQGSGRIAQGAGIIAQGGGVSAAGQGMVGFGQGMTSFGSSLVSAAPTFGNVANTLYNGTGNFFSPFSSGFGMRTLGRGY